MEFQANPPHLIQLSPPAEIAAWDPGWNLPSEALNRILETAFQPNSRICGAGFQPAVGPARDDLMEKRQQARMPAPQPTTSAPASRPATMIDEQSGCRVGPIEFRVTGPDDKPCPNAAVGFELSWRSTPESHKLALSPKTWRTDNAGVFRKESYRECVCPTVVYAVDEKRKLAGCTIVEQLKELDRPVRVKMLPARTVVGKIKFEAFGGLRPEYISVRFNPGESPLSRCLKQSSTLDSFEMLIPPGKWTVLISGSGSAYELPAPHRTFTIEAGTTDLILDDFEVAVATSQKLIGHAAPSWQVSSWHGGDRHALDDFKGKYVLINFWQAGSDPVPRMKEILELSGHCCRRVTSILISHPFAKGLSEIEAGLGAKAPATLAAFQAQLQKDKLRIGFDAASPLGHRHRGKTAESYGAGPFTSFLINPEGKILCVSDLGEIQTMLRWIEELERTD